MKNRMFFKDEEKPKSRYIVLIILFIIAIFLISERTFNGIFSDKENNLIANNLNIKNKSKEVKKVTKTNVEIKKDLGNMPSWNLTDLYSSANDENINLDLKKLKDMVNNFQKYKGKVKNMNGKQLYDAIIDYENIEELMAKLGSYSYLKYSENVGLDENVKLYQRISEELTNLSSDLVFFTLEINKIPEKRLQNMYKESKSLAVYKQVVEDSRAFKDHQLNEDLEKLLLEKSISGRNF